MKNVSDFLFFTQGLSSSKRRQTSNKQTNKVSFAKPYTRINTHKQDTQQTLTHTYTHSQSDTHTLIHTPTLTYYDIHTHRYIISHSRSQ